MLRDLYIKTRVKYLFISSILKIIKSLKSLFVWAYLGRNRIVLINLFWLTINLFMRYLLVPPQTTLQYIKEGYTTEKYKVFRAFFVK